jgi:hypothetical protein
MRPAAWYDRLTVHHTGVKANVHVGRQNVVRDLNGILDSHCDRNYGDIGYHFAVDYAGRVWEARSLSYEGAHVSGQNDSNIGVVLLGNFEAQRPSTAQLAVLRKLVLLLRGRYGIKQHRVYGHCDLGSSICPGRNLYGQVRVLRS